MTSVALTLLTSCQIADQESNARALILMTPRRRCQQLVTARAKLNAGPHPVKWDHRRHGRKRPPLSRHSDDRNSTYPRLRYR
jgi:hypothetical protein